MNELAIDCDLRKIFAVHRSADGYPSVICNRANRLEALPMIFDALELHRPVLLYEVAGTPYARVDSRAAARQTSRWSIFNAGVAGELFSLCDDMEIPFKVSTSTMWTRNIGLKERHAAARAVLKNKDLRECEAMIWSYRNMPSLWITYPEYLDTKL